VWCVVDEIKQMRDNVALCSICVIRYAIIHIIILTSSRGSSVGIVSDYGLDDRAIGVLSPAGAKDFSSSLLCPDRLWGPPSLLYNGYRGVLSPGQSAAGA
jgi:hypothetical protein